MTLCLASHYPDLRSVLDTLSDTGTRSISMPPNTRPVPPIRTSTTLSGRSTTTSDVCPRVGRRRSRLPKSDGQTFEDGERLAGRQIAAVLEGAPILGERVSQNGAVV